MGMDRFWGEKPKDEKAIEPATDAQVDATQTGQVGSESSSDPLMRLVFGEEASEPTQVFSLMHAVQ